MARKNKTLFPSPSKLSPRLLALIAIATALVALVIAVSATWMIVHANHSADEDFEAHDFEATVTISADGFLPGTLVVQPKTRVYFENHDGTMHRLMPSSSEPDSRFGASDPIEPNAGYAFTFTKRGDYKFYDASNPTANGEVVVK